MALSERDRERRRQRQQLDRTLRRAMLFGLVGIGVIVGGSVLVGGSCCWNHPPKPTIGGVMIGVGLLMFFGAVYIWVKAFSADTPSTSSSSTTPTGGDKVQPAVVVVAPTFELPPAYPPPNYKELDIGKDQREDYPHDKSLHTHLGF